VTNPYGAGPDVPRRINGWMVAIGIVLGIVATVVWLAVVLVFAVSQENSPSFPDWLAFVLFFLPLPVSVLLLCLRRTRHMAAGLVMGLAIGTIVLAGLCGSLLFSSMGA
jgi:hypothetical protein